MRLDVVAEGIERDEELAMLEEMGCPLGQGYLFSKPLSLQDTERMLGIGTRL